MYSQVQKYGDPQTVRLRQEIGRWLKERREATGRSQRAVAAMVGVEFYTWVSQLETGRGRVPPDKYEGYARALNMDVRDFVMKVFPYYDPVTAGILFPTGEAPSPAPEPGPAAAGGGEAAFWHREASDAQNSLRDLERRAGSQLRQEREQADAARAKLRDIESLLTEAAYTATGPSDGARNPQWFLMGFMGHVAEIKSEAFQRLAELGARVRHALKDEPVDLFGA